MDKLLLDFITKDILGSCPKTSSVTMPASLLLHEEKSTQKHDEILIKK